MRKNRDFLNLVAKAFEEVYSRSPTKVIQDNDEIEDDHRTSTTFITENRNKLSNLKKRIRADNDVIPITNKEML